MNHSKIGSNFVAIFLLKINYGKTNFAKCWQTFLVGKFLAITNMQQNVSTKFEHHNTLFKEFLFNKTL